MRYMILLLCCLWVLSAEAVTMAWNASARAQGYTLSYRQEGGQSVQVLDTGPATTAVVDHLQPGQRYYFGARAYNTAGISGYSNEVTVLAQAPAQEIKTYSMADGAFAWDWTEPDPAVTHYLIECGREPKHYTVTSQTYPIARLTVRMVDVVGRNQGNWYCQQVMLAGLERRVASINELPFVLLGAGPVLRGINK